MKSTFGIVACVYSCVHRLLTLMCYRKTVNKIRYCYFTKLPTSLQMLSSNQSLEWAAEGFGTLSMSVSTWCEWQLTERQAGRLAPELLKLHGSCWEPLRKI